MTSAQILLGFRLVLLFSFQKLFLIPSITSLNWLRVIDKAGYLSAFSRR